ncbi:reverse transcriptase domain-containing protein [Novosphingobium sp. FSW06-99]|uniref:reverse transcriptase domain-containing protein n=1 Tax=Novosphingobium sp. FSW06-99 TaxID=1739113 RepID=UPI00076C74BD|nr:reverse transcriptase domain-containing protein [Novosphingobium sp. FSW06-99]KUR75650.1 hypothetical protein AQZ49_14405 [Novosphingobium sp. FSW06-99]
MRDLYQTKFRLKADTWIYVPSEAGRVRGKEIKTAIEGRWKCPGNFYHLLDGGHVAAARRHRDAPYVASLDLRRFFDQVTRSKVHRALKRLGLPQPDAWAAACDSTVDKSPPQHRYSIPFGFVQSPLIASLVFAQSRLGKAIGALRGRGIEVTVYVDDITLSGESLAHLADGMDNLRSAAAASGFCFNEEKTRPPAAQTVGFNIEFGSGKMALVAERLAQFAAALETGSLEQIEGILGYIRSVSVDQHSELMGVDG